MEQLVTVEGELVMYTDDGPQLQQIVEVHQGIDLTEVRPPVWPLLHLAGVSQPREVQSWKPSGTKEVALDPVSPGGGGGGTPSGIPPGIPLIAPISPGGGGLQKLNCCPWILRAQARPV